MQLNRVFQVQSQIKLRKIDHRLKLLVKKKHIIICTRHSVHKYKNVNSARNALDSHNRVNVM